MPRTNAVLTPAPEPNVFFIKINKPAKLPEKAEALDAADEPVLAESA